MRALMDLQKGERLVWFYLPCALGLSKIKARLEIQSTRKVERRI
ncbi:hypothetical protein SPSYN_00339 [Sporotomaculum syntrophicum]|uniref:Uncharacterized protein n=1 Tax=Sporotomaculum syntrophicum TaxID=182264 RepID=A0A9D3AXE5_9FIRM|nr:hypothetical protein SPSYN_00339 [Sporotomaculum syntrophicum]